MNHSLIHNLTNYLLLNAYSFRSNGLYNGKAGVSLCLFELSRHNNDEKVEEHALELLQESLALSDKTKDIYWEDGLSGIGFVLLYLIVNKFLDADFEELFGEQLRVIQSQLEKQTEFSKKDLTLTYLGTLLSHYQNKTEHIIPVFEILKKNENILKKQLEAYDSIDSKEIKYDVLNHMESYVKTASICTNYKISKTLINRYIELYERRRAFGNFSTGHYLEKTAITEKEKLIVGGIKRNAIQNIYPDTLSLAQRTELLYLMSQHNQCYQDQIKQLEKGLFDMDNLCYERDISLSVLNQDLMAGYSSGVARLLLYWVYKETNRNDPNFSRFKYLF